MNFALNRVHTFRGNVVVVVYPIFELETFFARRYAFRYIFVRSVYIFFNKTERQSLAFFGILSAPARQIGNRKIELSVRKLIFKRKIRLVNRHNYLIEKHESKNYEKSQDKILHLNKFTRK